MCDIGERGPKSRYPEWLVMFIAILSVKPKVKSYAKIHKIDKEANVERPLRQGETLYTPILFTSYDGIGGRFPCPGFEGFLHIFILFL